MALKIFMLITGALIQTILFIVLAAVGLILATSRTGILVGIKSMVVLTGSMGPTIPAGSIVFTFPADLYSRGDIITFKNKAGAQVTHRITREVTNEQGTFYKVKGDANQSADSELVPFKAVVGKTVLFIPWIGKLVQNLHSWPAFAGFILLPALTLVGYELWRIKNEIVKMTERRMLARM